MACSVCATAKAIILRSKDKTKVCKECFFTLFEGEMHDLITETGMFPRGSRVGLGISGGKDSTVLAYVLDKLNKQHDYGIELIMLCVDEGIVGYRDRSIETVLENQKLLGMELHVLSFEELFGLSMDEVVRRIGRRGNCTYCGAFRRQALEAAARRAGADCIVTGHNADDMAETVLLNLVRGDASRMRRCTLAKTAAQAAENGSEGLLSLPRCKPFKCTYQKEIVLYAYFKKLPYFSTECTYAPGASRGDARTLLKELERADTRIIHQLIKGAEQFAQQPGAQTAVGKCTRCSHPTSSSDRVCTACGMVERLNKMNGK